MSLTRLDARRARAGLLFALGLVVAAATGCVHYTIHVQVEPNQKLVVTERAEMLPGVAESLHVEPRLAWSAFQATVEGRAGRFHKDRPDSLHGAEGTYPLDDWAEFGQRGQAFKGVDEIERRTRPANVKAEVNDQYFYKDTTLEYQIELTEPTGASVDSSALGFLEQATGRFELQVPGQILKDNAPEKNGNTLIYPFKYGDTVDVQVSYRQLEWVAMVSTALVALFFIYLLIAGIRNLGSRNKPKAA